MPPSFRPVETDTAIFEGSMILPGRKIYPGVVEGEALVTPMGISFFGGVDPDSGVVVERGHTLEGQSVAGKVLVFPTGKGSTVGSYTLYRMQANGVAPLAIVNAESETITAVGCIIAEIPCVDRISLAPLASGQRLRVDAGAGIVEILNSAPEPLRGNVPGTFAEDSMARRLSEIAGRVLEETDWFPAASRRLEALIADMPHGQLRLLEDRAAPDAALWADWLAPYLGQTWLTTPWFVAETYFFRRILEASGYFEPGDGHGVDPYRSEKQRGMESAVRPLAAAWNELKLAQPGEQPAETPALQSRLARLLRRVIWGNQADSSLWPADSEGPDEHDKAELDAHLVADDAAAVSAYLTGRLGTNTRVDFVLDNGGLELGYDLLLAEFLLDRRLAQRVHFHVKPYPTFVSDVTAADMDITLAFLESAGEPGLQKLAERLRAHIAAGRLGVFTDDYWISPLPGWQMPYSLRSELSGSDLIISKGDANYRRWLGDRPWPTSSAFAERLAYRPAPMLALRVIKEEILVGLPDGKKAELNRQDPDWRYNGNWGVVQFAP